MIIMINKIKSFQNILPEKDQYQNHEIIQINLHNHFLHNYHIHQLHIPIQKIIQIINQIHKLILNLNQFLNLIQHHKNNPILHLNKHLIQNQIRILKVDQIQHHNHYHNNHNNKLYHNHNHYLDQIKDHKHIQKQIHIHNQDNHQLHKHQILLI
jgi:hypothetical protein